jgi:hypothetical protein
MNAYPVDLVWQEVDAARARVREAQQLAAAAAAQLPAAFQRPAPKPAPRPAVRPAAALRRPLAQVGHQATEAERRAVFARFEQVRAQQRR